MRNIRRGSIDNLVNVGTSKNFVKNDEVLLGIFDGRGNEEVPAMMAAMVPTILQEERNQQQSIDGNTEYLRYTLLTANR